MKQIKKEVSTGCSTKLTQIAVNDLQIGMFVSKLDRSWQETSFLLHGFEVQTQADIEALQLQCSHVFIDISKQKPKVQANLHLNAILENSSHSEWESNFNQQMYSANQTCKQLSTLVTSFMQDVRLGHSINVALAKEIVSHCVDTVIKSPDAMMFLTQLKNRDVYTSQHSMNVAVFAIALGKHLNLSVSEMNHLGLCGMMHDMGKMQIPLEVLNKPGRLTPEETVIMRSHTTLGWKLLMSSSNMYGGASDVAYSHHEKLDGTGYPRGLKADQISFYTRVVTLVDMYDAITSDRVYQKGRTHLEAISIMSKKPNTHLDTNLTAKFIECLGIYPPGNLIEMDNGEVAIVLESNPQHTLKPKIMLILDEHQQFQTTRIIDLLSNNHDKHGQPYKIKKMIRAEDYHLDLTAFYHQYLLQTA